jgi:uncharacterized membrane protein
MAALSELMHNAKRRTSISRGIMICIKCGSEDVNREEDSLVCIDCGAVLFYSNDT